MTATTNPAAVLAQMEQELNATLIGRGDAIRALLAALVAREHVVLLGPPGTAKSMLVEQLSTRVQGTAMFEWLMTKFTTPDELFGPVSVQGLKRDEYRRITTGKLPEAEFAFLDEVFKAGSAILNSLLTLMNERKYDNGGVRQSCPLFSLVGASNELPEGDDSGALWDRFLVRVVVDYLPDSDFAQLLALSVASAPTVTLTGDDLRAAQRDAQAVAIPASVLEAIVALRRALTGQGIVIGDRRWRKALSLLQANAYLDGRTSVDEDDLTILRHVLWQRPDQRAAVTKAIAQIGNPLTAAALELLDQANSVQEGITQRLAAITADEERSKVLIEGMTKYSKIVKKLDDLHVRAQREQRSTAKVDSTLAHVKTLNAALAKEMGF